MRWRSAGIGNAARGGRSASTNGWCGNDDLLVAPPVQREAALGVHARDELGRRAASCRCRAHRSRARPAGCPRRRRPTRRAARASSGPRPLNGVCDEPIEGRRRARRSPETRRPSAAAGSPTGRPSTTSSKTCSGRAMPFSRWWPRSRSVCSSVSSSRTMAAVACETQDLAAVSDRHQARRPVERRPEVVAVPTLRAAGVDAEPGLQRSGTRPVGAGGAWRRPRPRREPRRRRAANTA